MSVNYLITYYAFETTKTVLWWSGGKMLYLVTPSIVYKLLSPKSENQRILDELRLVRQELQEISRRTQIPIAEEGIEEIEVTPTKLLTRTV
jgi:hypothetical protein